MKGEKSRFESKTTDADNHDGVPHKSLVTKRFLFREKTRNFSRKIAPTTRLSTSKICTMSAGKVGVFQLTENFVRSVCYRNARLQFAVFPTASFGRENETAPRGGTGCCADQESRADAMLGAAEKGMEACKDLGY
jgi:hypothetical protein